MIGTKSDIERDLMAIVISHYKRMNAFLNVSSLKDVLILKVPNSDLKDSAEQGLDTKKKSIKYEVARLE